jgi:uncharacterized protein (DUF58 family)
MQAMLRWLDPILNPMACLPAPPEEQAATENAEHLLKRLEAMLRHQLRYALAGERRSIIRGQGLDFADLREYAPGDDIRKIDWNVFARTLTPHVREYHEEKQLTLWLVLDITPSMQFGRTRTKLQQAIDLAGLLGLMAHRANHKLGAFLILGKESYIIPPKTGYAHLQHIMQRMLDAKSNSTSDFKNQQTDPLPAAFQQLGHVVAKNATVMVLSDFLSLSHQWQTPLGQLSRHTKLVYFLLHDPVESQLPAQVGRLSVIDPETGELAEIDTNDRQFLKHYQQYVSNEHTKRLHWLQETGLATLASTTESPLEILQRLLQSQKTGIPPASQGKSPL